MDAAKPALGTGDRPLICERCGAEFGCARDRAGGCWCTAESFRLPVPLPTDIGSFGDCLCPSCLREVAALLAARR